MCCSTMRAISPPIRPRSCSCGRAACRFTAASWAACSPWSCSRAIAASPFLSLGDVTCAAGPIGLFLGRIANFINGELWGRPSDVPWAMVFPNGGPLPRHPSQLYEATLEGLVLFAVLFVLVRARRAEAARHHHRRVRARLRDDPHVLRAVPRARRAARISLARPHHGNAAVAAADARRHRLHRGGAAARAATFRPDDASNFRRWKPRFAGASRSPARCRSCIT